MSPQGQNPGQRIKPSNNLYTAILTVASLTVLATVVYVLLFCICATCSMGQYCRRNSFFDY